MTYYQNYFIGTGYDSRGNKCQDTNERCRLCLGVFNDHHNGKCPCDICSVVHHNGVCPEEEKEQHK